MILLLILFLIFIPVPAQAVTTPSPTTTITLSPTVNPSNVDEIQKIRQAVQEKVKEKLNQIVNPEDNKKGVFGKITTLESATITINHQDKDLVINTDENTVIIDINRKNIDITKLKVGQSILVLGFNNNSQDTFDAKRIVAYDPSFLPVKSIITVGKIIDRSQSSNVALLLPVKNKDSQYQITFSTTTLVTNLENKTLTLKEIATGKKVIAVLTPNLKTKSLFAEKIILVDKVAADQ